MSVGLADAEIMFIISEVMSGEMEAVVWIRLMALLQSPSDAS